MANQQDTEAPPPGWVRAPCGHNLLAPSAVYSGSMNRRCKQCSINYVVVVESGVATEWRKVK